MRRTRGFTLIELMIVVALVALAASLTARAFSKGVRGEKTPAFVRSLMSQLLEARHQALTLGRPTRVQLLATSPAMTVETDVYDPNASQWNNIGTASVPLQVQLCQPTSGPSVGSLATQPTCPMVTGGSNKTWLCFSPNGHLNLEDPTTGCSTASSPSGTSGATLYVTDVNQSVKYRIMMWGLTGMPKLIDKW